LLSIVTSITSECNEARSVISWRYECSRIQSNRHVERTLTAEIKLYYEVHKPEVLPAPLLIALHGYGANKKQMMREARQIAPESFAIVSLQGFHQHMKEPKEAGGPLRFGSAGSQTFIPKIRLPFIIRHSAT